MKKIIYTRFILGFIFSVFLLASCDNENQQPVVDLGANVLLEYGSISNFDRDEELDLKIITNPNVSVESISIFKDGTKVADANLISSDKATFSASVLSPYNQFGEDKDEDFGTFDDISIVSSLSNGNTIDNIYPITVKKALSLGNSSVSEIEYKNPYTSEEHIEVVYNVFTAKANLDEVKVEWKKNSGGAYATVDKDGGLAFGLKTDTINLKSLDLSMLGFQKGDTLYCKFTAIKGVITESLETGIIILPQTMNSTGSFTFSSENSQFSFSDSEEAELEYSYPSTLMSSGAITFSKLTLSGDELKDYYNRGDLFDARDDFEATSPVSTISSLQKDEVYLYKVVRDELEFYGMIKIGDIVIVNDQEEISIEFKEGNILE
ncbi:MAG: hypothetical protein ACK5H1_10620 [Tenacibaculum sp.]